MYYPEPQAQPRNYYNQPNAENNLYRQNPQMTHAQGHYQGEQPRNAYEGHFYEGNTPAYNGYNQQNRQHEPYNQTPYYYQEDARSTQYSYGNHEMGSWDYESYSQQEQYCWTDAGSIQLPSSNQNNGETFSSNFSQSQPGYHKESWTTHNTNDFGTESHTHMTETIIKIHQNSGQDATQKPHAKDFAKQSSKHSQSGRSNSKKSKFEGPSKKSVKTKALKRCSEDDQEDSTGSSKRYSPNIKTEALVGQEATTLVLQQAGM
jgi:hypothetical protein